MTPSAGSRSASIRFLEVSVPSHVEAVEAVSEILDRVGYNGIAVDIPLDPADPHLVKAYLVYDRTARIKVRRVLEAIGRLRAFGLGPVGEVAVRRVADEDWLEGWKAHFAPARIGPFLVRPSWIASSAPLTSGIPSSAPSASGISGSVAGHADGVELVLDPGMAFGTGLHPTTRQCLEAAGALDLAGRSALDVGTGSGILAIAAAKRGARPVVAVDVDPVAVRTARENAARNGVAVDVREGSAGDVAGTYDVVFANLVADVLVRVAADLRARLAPGGTLVAAGIVREQEDGVTDAFRVASLSLAGRDQRDDWVRLDAR